MRLALFVVLARRPKSLLTTFFGCLGPHAYPTDTLNEVRSLVSSATIHLSHGCITFSMEYPTPAYRIN